MPLSPGDVDIGRLEHGFPDPHQPRIGTGKRAARRGVEDRFARCVDHAEAVVERIVGELRKRRIEDVLAW